MAVGALGLNTVGAERDWPDAVVQRFRLVAQILTNALARERREQRLQESERRLAAGADIAGLAFYEVDFEGGAMYVSDRYRDLFGIPADQELGLSVLSFWTEHLHPDDRPTVLRLREELHSGKVEQLSVEYRFLNPTQGERWIEHLARELHDDVTQRLAVLAIDVGRAELVAGDESQADAMRSVRVGLVRISEDIHSLAYQLHPSVLEELGLVEALRAECERRVRQGPLELSTPHRLLHTQPRAVEMTIRNSSSTSITVPRASAVGMGDSTAPPSSANADSASRSRLVSVTWATEAIDARASPRKPSKATFSRSSSEAIFEVA